MHCSGGQNPKIAPSPWHFVTPQGKIASVVPEISSRTDKQTQTDVLITILHMAPAVNGYMVKRCVLAVILLKIIGCWFSQSL